MMKTPITFDIELKKEVHSLESWAQQFGHVVYTLFWLLKKWLFLSVFLVGFACIVGALAHNGNEITLQEFQSVFRFTVSYCAMIAAVYVVVAIAPTKFQNIFEEKAMDRVERYHSIKDKIEQQTDTTERLLVSYGLIDQSDIDKRVSQDR